MAAIRSRTVGSLMGLAVCDSVGTTVEFMPPGSFKPVTDMEGGGKFSLLPGQWTDDTSMALCLCESLIECRGFNPVDQCKRYWRWYQEGHLSSNGECFDIGKTIRKALHTFDRSGQTNPYPGSTADSAAGNGSLMRLCPVPLLYHRYPMVAMDMSADSSRTTHGAKAALDACRYFAGLIIGCLQGVSKEELLSSHYCPEPGYWDKHPLAPEVEAVVSGSFKQLEPPEIVAAGYVVRSLEAVLWAFYHTSNFKDGCLKVVNLGNDADTVGAIYGQLSGAFYGVEAIPEAWRKQCSLSPLIELFADELCRFSENIQGDALLPQDITPSVSYQNIKLKGYDLLEERNREIVRRLNPCPKQYKSLEAFAADVQALTKQYKLLPAEAQSSEILGDFERRWESAKEKLALRLGRRL